MAQQLGGKVEPSDEREYGPAKVTVDERVGIFAPFTKGEELGVWMSHGDRLTGAAAGLSRASARARTRRSPRSPTPSASFYGIQFHPEVAHTPRGTELIRAFLFDVAGPRAELDAGLVRRRGGRRRRGQGRPERARDLRPDRRRRLVGRGGALPPRARRSPGLHLRGQRPAPRGRVRERRAHDARELPPEPRAGRRARAVPDELCRASPIPKQKRKIIGRVFIEVFEEHAARVENAQVPRAGHALPRRDRERQRARARAPSSRATTTSAACPSA